MTDPLRAHWAAQIEGLNEVLGLLDKASATVIQLEAVEENEHNKRLRASLYQGIASSRNFAAEIERAVQELLNCRCEGTIHNPDCLASPTRLNRFGDHAIVEGLRAEKRDPHGDSTGEEDSGQEGTGESPSQESSGGSGQGGSVEGSPEKSGGTGSWKAVSITDLGYGTFISTRQEGGGATGGGGEPAQPG